MSILETTLAFFVETNDSNVRREVIESYKNQGNDQEVVFICHDGKQRCSRMILNCFSNFYAAQLAGRDRMRNPPVFTYDGFGKRTIKCFLDIMHGLDDIGMTLGDVMEMMRFLYYEGKSDNYEKEGGFEGKLLWRLIGFIIKAKLRVDTKLLICLIARTFDHSSDIYSFEELLFQSHSIDDVGKCLLSLDLSEMPNDQLRELFLTYTSDEQCDEFVAIEVCRLAREMMKSKILRGRTVNIRFFYTGVYMFTMAVDTNHTVAELIEKVNARRSFYGRSGTVESLQHNGKDLESRFKLKSYKLCDGQIIDYEVSIF